MSKYLRNIVNGTGVGMTEDGVLRCVQPAGTALFVPAGWGHGVLNLQETVGFANELAFTGPPEYRQS